MESIHYFIHHPEVQDIFITRLFEVFKEFPENKKWFFIRYWHGGPHVRVRFDMDNTVEEKLKGILDEIIQLKDYELTKQQYYANHSFDGEEQDIDKLPFYNNGEAISIPYEPEYDRYGRGELLNLSEYAFKTSSAIVSRFLQMTMNPNAKIALSIFMFYFFLSLINDKKSFLERYYMYWNRINEKPLVINSEAFSAIEKLVEQMDFEKIFNKELGDLRTYLKEIDSRINNSDTFSYLISSHVHMTNNRISVVPKLEAMIAKKLLENWEARNVD